MKFSYNFLQSFFNEKLPSPEELGNLLMMHFFEVEEVKKVEDDFLLDIDILSSRAGDCLSHMGVAREVAAITGMKCNFPQEKPKESREDLSSRIDVEIRGACNRYTLCAIEGLEVGESPSYIKKRLRTCGIKPINSVVDITNYVMLETGQPLHAFDADKLEGKKVIARYAKKREKIVTLEEKRYELDNDILVIADEFSPIGIAGIKGGIVPEVDKKTTNIYLEAANFDQGVIRRGSKKLGIRTDASLRFEYGLPVELTEIALERAASIMSEVSGGKILKGSFDHYSGKAEEKEISFDADEVRDVLGVKIPLKEMEKILKGLDFKTRRSENRFYVTRPYFRLDIEEKEDVIEEIGRIYGYEKIEEEAPMEEIIPSKGENSFSTEKECREIWKGYGFSESYNYSFIDEKSAFLLDKEKLIEMEKPVSLEFKYLRPSLLTGLLKNLNANERNFASVELFEIGKVFSSEKNGTKEEKKIAMISSRDDFYGIKGKIDLFLQELFHEEVSYLPSQEKNKFFNGNRLATIKVKGEIVGEFGEISAEARKIMKVKSNAVMAELDFHKLQNLRKDIKEYEPILRFPPSIRDIALLVPQETFYDEVFEKIRKAGGRTLKKITLFDSYQGKELPEGMKSFAFRLSFQDKNKTLSSKEVEELQKRVIKEIEKMSDWKVRK